MENQIDFYRILQVDPSAEPEVIDATYRRLARKYHPDSRSPEASEERMRQLNQAYEVLSDPVKRGEYDRALRGANAVRRRQEEAEARQRAEREALMNLLLRSLAQRTGAQADRFGRAFTMNDLDGTAVIRAQDGTYLGLISSDPYEPDSIVNAYGTYGNPFSPSSIRNQYGTYGGQYGAQSPYNPYSVNPPVVIKNGRIVAYLTVNQSLRPAISPHDLFAQLGHG